MSAEHTRSAVVTGASRGFGRAISTALVGAGLSVAGIALHPDPLHQLQEELGPAFVPVAGDATDEALAARVLTEFTPSIVVLNAGAAPVMASLADQTWQSFSRPWEVDVQQAFVWMQQILRHPLAPGSTVVALSSGAALQGSPLSGGYAGAKSTVRFVTSYAAQESARAGLGVRFTCVLPRLTPATDLGADAVAAYAERAGLDVPAFLASFGPVSGPADIAAAVVRLATDPSLGQPAYLVQPPDVLVAL